MHAPALAVILPGFQVQPGAESAPGATQNNHADVVALMQPLEIFRECRHQRFIERIEGFGTVQRGDLDATAPFNFQNV